MKYEASHLDWRWIPGAAVPGKQSVQLNCKTNLKQRINHSWRCSSQSVPRRSDCRSFIWWKTSIQSRRGHPFLKCGSCVYSIVWFRFFLPELLFSYCKLPSWWDFSSWALRQLGWITTGWYSVAAKYILRLPVPQFAAAGAHSVIQLN